jgi:hypothetical protein
MADMQQRSGPSRRRTPRFTVATVAGLTFLASCVSRTAIEGFEAKHEDFILKATSLAPISLTGTWVPDTTIEGEPGELNFTQGLLDATLPLPLDADSFLIVGALAGVRDVHFDGVPVLADDQLHRYGVRLGYGRFLSDNWLVQGYWQPSIYSDLDGTLNSDDYRPYYGTLLSVYRTSPTWFWKAGLTSNDAADTCIIPLGGFAWHFADRWSMQVLAPRDANLVYASGPWLVSMGFMMESDEYHVRSPDALDLEHDVHVQELYAHVTVERALSRHVSFLIRSGSTVSGEWDWGYGSGTERYDGTIEPGAFVVAGLSYRFSRWRP